MKVRNALTALGLSLPVALPLAAWTPTAAAQVTPEEAHAIGVDAYLYFYPLVTVDLTRDLYFQNQSPGAGKEADWLPAPKEPLNLTMRLYAPKSDALRPPVFKAQAPSFLQAQ